MDELLSICMYSFCIWFVAVLGSIWFPFLVELANAFLMGGSIYATIIVVEIVQQLIRMQKGEFKA